MPSNEVYDVLQDEFGYIWIGCDAGLFRYDGFRFKEYRSTFENGKSKSCIRLDTKGNVWCQNFNGQIYRVAGDSLFLVQDLSQSNFINSHYALDDNQHVWVIKNGRLVELNDLGDSLSSFEIQQNSIFTVTSLVYHDQKLYFSNFKGQLFVFDQATKQVQIHAHYSSESDDRLLKLVVKNNRVYIIEEAVFTKNYQLFELQGSEVKSIQKFTNTNGTFRIFSLNLAMTEELWMGSNMGALAVSKHQIEGSALASLLPGKKVSSLFQDREGMVWLATLDEGIFIIPHKGVIHLNAQNSTLSESNITALFSSDKLLYIGTHSGNVFEFNLITKQLHQLPNAGGLISVKKISKQNNNLTVSNGFLRELNGHQMRLSQLSNLRDYCIIGDSMYFVQPEFTGSIAIENIFTADAEERAIKKLGGGRVLCYHPKQEQLYLGLSSGLFVEKYGERNEITYNEKKILSVHNYTTKF